MTSNRSTGSPHRAVDPRTAPSPFLSALTTRRRFLRQALLASGLATLPAGLLSACAGDDDAGDEAAGTAGGGSSTPAADAVTVGLTTSIAGLGDQGFNDLAAAGVEQAKAELGVDGTVVEAQAETDYVPNMRGFASDGYGLVYAVGFLMQDALTEVATEFPDINFGIIDAVVDLPNVVSNTFREEQGSFLAGAFAALMTLESGIPKMTGSRKLGFIGGGDVPLIHKFQEGFQQGAAQIDESIEVLVAYAGSFTDPAAGKELALSQYNDGADMVYQAAGPTGSGVIEAAQELDRYVIGVDADQNPVAPDHVITSMLKNVDVAVFETIRSVVEGSFAAGANVFGIENGGVGLAPFHSMDSVVPQAVKDRIQELTEQLKAGDIEITLSGT